MVDYYQKLKLTSIISKYSICKNQNLLPLCSINLDIQILDTALSWQCGDRRLILKMSLQQSVSKKWSDLINRLNDLLEFIYQLVWFNRLISASRVWWIESTEFLLTIDRVVASTHSRNVVVVVIRNLPHPSLPDGPTWSCRHTEADHQGERQQLGQGDIKVVQRILCSY